MKDVLARYENMNDSGADAGMKFNYIACELETLGNEMQTAVDAVDAGAIEKLLVSRNELRECWINLLAHARRFELQSMMHLRLPDVQRVCRTLADSVPELEQWKALLEGAVVAGVKCATCGKMSVFHERRGGHAGGTCSECGAHFPGVGFPVRPE